MFQAPKLTNLGKALYYDNMSGQGINFTSIKLGKGTLSGSIANLTDLVDTVVTMDAALSNAGEYVDISGQFSNEELSEGFYWKEIGVFVSNPNYPNDRSRDILYCYQNAYDTADFIPVASIETVEKYITIPIIVGDAANVSCNINSSLVNISMQEFESHTNDSDAHVSSQEKLGWNNKMDKVTGHAAGNFPVLNADGTIRDSEKKPGDYALKHVINTLTMVAGNWTQAGTYSFEDVYPSLNFDIEIEPSKTCTADQLKAWSAAQIVGSATDNIVKAFGTVPEVDIPLIVKAVVK